uniref:Phytocyanin domain-containing protein n=1 Tax=Brassica oleracea TaxID=3712 RepID=A0A3P6BFR2_BRAOL|nr:unnamed protein product [Brassica oleracea]
MGLSKARKLLLVLLITAYFFSGTAHAWSWSWGSGQSGSSWGWGWGSDNNSGSGSGSSNSNTGGGSSWGWGWSSNGTDTNWGWGSSSGSNHSSGTGSIHKNHSSGTGSTHNYHMSSGSNHTSGSIIGSSHNNHTPRRKIEVSVWKNGFDYQEWASKHAPFHTNDVLSFKYNDKSQSKTKKHNNKNDVYLLPDLKSYKRCDVSRGKKLVARGGSSLGFKLLLRKTPETYYFASGDHNGCNHNMKFSVSPIPRSSSHTKP